MFIISDKKSQKLSSYPSVIHFITYGGIGSKAFNDFNLSMKVNSPNSQVVKRREQLASEIDTCSNLLFFPDQCHTDNIKIVTKKTNDCDLKKTDALITDSKDICICVMAADCVPLLLYDPVKEVIAAIHAGWRGTEKMIVSKSVKKMVQEFGCNPAQIIAFIGPSICKNCYEVGEEVAAMFKKQDYPDEIFSFFSDTGKIYIDLWKINVLQLKKSGFIDENIEVSGICTFEDVDLFSARRDGFYTGRFAVGIGMKEKLNNH